MTPEMFSGQGPSCCRVSYALLILALFFAPLAFGTTEAWSLATLELLIAMSCLFYVCAALPSRSAPLYTVPALLPLSLLIAWIYIQCIPLPPQLVRLLSPNSHAAYGPLLEISRDNTWIPLTVNRKATLLEGLRITAYGLFYFVAVQLLTRHKRLVKTVTMVAMLAMLIGLLALLQKFTSPHKIFWFREIPASAWQGALGPWVYPNQYGGFMVMILPLVLALFLNYRPSREIQSFRQRFISLFSGPGSSMHLFTGFGAIILFLSIVLSRSRSGIVSAFLAMAFFFGILSRTHSRVRRITVLTLSGCFLFSISWFDWQPVLDRFLHTLHPATDGLHEGRFRVWQDALAIIGDFPVTGSGFSTFADVFPGYKSFTDIYIYDHAHNDFMELFTDGGIVGFSLAAWFVMAVLISSYKQIQTRRDKTSILFAAAATSGIGGILVYSLTDFNLHNGANGLYFFFLCSLLVSAAHTRKYYRSLPTLLSPVAGGQAARVSLPVTVFFLLAVVVVQGGTLMGDYLFDSAETVNASMMRPEKKIRRMTELIEKARQYDPFNGRYSFALANLEKREQDNSRALNNALAAAMQQPMEGAFLQAAGELLIHSDPDKGKVLIETGSLRSGMRESGGGAEQINPGKSP